MNLQNKNKVLRPSGGLMAICEENLSSGDDGVEVHANDQLLRVNPKTRPMRMCENNLDAEGVLRQQRDDCISLLLLVVVGMETGLRGWNLKTLRKKLLPTKN